MIRPMELRRVTVEDAEALRQTVAAGFESFRAWATPSWDPPAVGFEMSTITDFNGVVAAADIQGAATGSDGSTFGFDTDMRFMDGEFVGEDGRLHHGTFGFV